MTTQLVYLCGPITGLSYGEAAHGWRFGVKNELAGKTGGRIQCISPMRAKANLKEETVLAALPPATSALTSPRGIRERDEFDVHRSDLIFANLLGAQRVSIGSVMEIAWAWRARIPSVIVMEPGNVHEHCFVTECSSFIVPTLEEAVETTLAILGTGL